MSAFNLQAGDEVMAITERQARKAPPLSWFCRLAAAAAGLHLKGQREEASSFVRAAVDALIRDGAVLKDFCGYLKVVEGVMNLLMGERRAAIRSWQDGFAIDPSNIYALSLLKDVSDADQSAHRWVERRISEISAWQGHEDVVVVGDSHAYSFNGVARCDVRYVGSVTMHRVGQSGLNFPTFDIDSLETHKAVALSFGEIDARAHVVKQRERSGRTLDAVVIDVVERYVDKVAAAFAGRPHSVALLGVVPPIRAALAADGFVHGRTKTGCSSTGR